MSSPHPRFGNAEWTPADDAALIALWHAVPTISAAKIGVKISRTVGSVVGRKCRLGLPSRPSPIKPRKIGRPAIVRQAAALPRMWIASPDSPVMVDDVDINLAMAERPVETKYQPRTPHQCRWPLWGMSRPTHLYCDATANGGPYCATHHARAFHTPKPMSVRSW